MTYILKPPTPAAAGVYRLRLEGPHAFTAPGQFAEVSVPGFFLRRPFSVRDWDESGFSLTVRVSGPGTAALAGLPEGAEVSALTGLGRGFDLALCGPEPLLVGGGTGVSPLLGLARRLVSAGARPTAALGFRSESDVFLSSELEAAGARVLVYTEDGSRGLPGLVTAAVEGLAYTGVCACGPEPMLRAVLAASSAPCQLSLEARMGCGAGLCMGCAIETAGGPKRVCRDGPVFRGEELLWQT